MSVHFGQLGISDGLNVYYPANPFPACRGCNKPPFAGGALSGLLGTSDAGTPTAVRLATAIVLAGLTSNFADSYRQAKKYANWLGAGVGLATYFWWT